VNKLRQNSFFKFFIILISVILIAISIKDFYAPHAIAPGGATGIAILTEAAFGWSISLITLIINIIMIVLAIFFLNKAVVGRILLGSFLLPLMLYLIPETKVLNDALFSAIVGSFIFAVGVSLLYSIDASSGGTTVPPLILKKYFNIRTSVGLLLIDFIISIGNIFVKGVEPFFLAIFSILLTSIIMNYIDTGINRKKKIYIMSNKKNDEIEEFIRSELPHGLTILSVVGGYSNEKRKLLMVVVENSESSSLIKKVLSIDKNAFITVNDISTVHGGIFVDD